MWKLTLSIIAHFCTNCLTVYGARLNILEFCKYTFIAGDSYFEIKHGNFPWLLIYLIYLLTVERAYCEEISVFIKIVPVVL